jgi:hypothetical protein
MIPVIRVQAGSFWNAIAAVVVIPCDDVPTVERLNGMPTVHFLEKCVHIRKVCAICQRRQPRITDDRVDLDSGHLLDFRVEDHC